MVGGIESRRKKTKRVVTERSCREGGGGCPSNRPRHGNVVVARACYVTSRVYREIPIAVLVTLCFVYIILPPDGRGIPPRSRGPGNTPIRYRLSSPFQPPPRLVHERAPQTPHEATSCSVCDVTGYHTTCRCFVASYPTPPFAPGHLSLAPERRQAAFLSPSVFSSLFLRLSYSVHPMGIYVFHLCLSSLVFPSLFSSLLATVYVHSCISVPFLFRACLCLPLQLLFGIPFPVYPRLLRDTLGAFALSSRLYVYTPLFCRHVPLRTCAGYVCEFVMRESESERECRERGRERMV